MAKIVERPHRRLQVRAFLARFSAFSKAAFLIALAVLVVALCTAGSTKSVGKAFYATEDTPVVFYLDYQDNSTLEKIYVNVGTAYVPAGSTYTLTFKSALYNGTLTSSNGKLSPSWSTSYGLGTVTLSNLWQAPAEGEDTAEAVGSNYNWVLAVDRSDNTSTVSTSRRLVQVSFSGEMFVNEIVFVDSNDNVIPAYVGQSDVRALYDAAGNIGKWDEGYRDCFARQTNGEERLVDGDGYFAGSTPYTNYTQDEMLTLMQIDNILLGNRAVEGTFVADTDNGPLAALFPLLGVLIFGKSPFGLRFFSAFFAAGAVLLVYLFLRDVFRRGEQKHNGWALLGAALFAGGGLLLSVGRLGLSYSLLACLLVGSLWSMFRFFAYGIDRERPARSACNVLTSGILFALAFCVDPKMLLAAVGIVGLFIAGAVRHARRNAAAAAQIRAELDEKNASERSEEVLYRNIEEAEGKERALRSEAVYQNKLIYLLFFVSFVVGTVLLFALTALPLYSTYARLYDPDPVAGTMSIFTLLGKAFKDSFAVGNVTAYSAGNASSAFGWLIALKGATLFASESPYVRLNANINVFMAFTALLAFVFLTVYAALYLATGRSRSAYNTPYTAHILRAYAVLTAGLLSALLPYAFVSASAVASLPFSALWLAYIPLAFYTAYVHDGSAKRRLFGRFGMNATAIALTVCIVLYAATFILTLPAVFAFPFPAAASAACYGWMSLQNNGWYR